MHSFISIFWYLLISLALFSLFMKCKITVHTGKGAINIETGFPYILNGRDFLKKNIFTLEENE